MASIAIALTIFKVMANLNAIKGYLIMVLDENAIQETCRNKWTYNT